MLINSRPVMRTGPEVPQEAASLPVPPPPPRPVINFTTNLRSPHHAGCEKDTFTNIHVPFVGRGAPPPALECPGECSACAQLVQSSR